MMNDDDGDDDVMDDDYGDGDLENLTWRKFA